MEPKYVILRKYIQNMHKDVSTHCTLRSTLYLAVLQTLCSTLTPLTL